MAGEVRLEALTMRLNDDVVEVVGPQSTELIPIDKLGGRVQRGPNGKVRVQIGWLVTEPVVPQYGWSFAPFSKARVFDLESVEELQVRAFFQQIATRCGREVEQEPPPKQKRRWLRRGGSDSSS